jgi:hypothetical protein
MSKVIVVENTTVPSSPDVATPEVAKETAYAGKATCPAALVFEIGDVSAYTGVAVCPSALVPVVELVKA